MMVSFLCREHNSVMCACVSLAERSCIASLPLWSLFVLIGCGFFVVIISRMLTGSSDIPPLPCLHSYLQSGASRVYGGIMGCTF